MTAPPDLSAALAGRYRLERELGQGGVRYEMLAGEPSYSGPTAQAIVVRWLVEGSVVRAGNRIQITAQLVPGS